MKFKHVELADRERLGELLAHYEGRVCDLSPGNIIFWRDYYDISYADEGEALFLRFGDMDDVESYYCPVEREPLEKLLAHAGGQVRMSCLTVREVELLREMGYEVTEEHHDRDWEDYLYVAENIISLSGRKFNGQRNHINKFKKTYGDYSFEPITKANAHAVAEFCRAYFHVFGKEKAKVAEYEERMICEQMRHWEEYGQLGGILRVGGKIVGISVGEVVGKTLIIHTEKADTSYLGAYPMLVNCFASAYGRNCLYINREEDCGEEGLRTSKLSYHPVELLEKYTAVVRG